MSKLAFSASLEYLFYGSTYKYFNSFQNGDRLYTSESDVYRRQIQMYKDGPRTEGIKCIFSARITK